jgi:hypothetical protein
MADFTHYGRLEPRPRDNALTHTLSAPIRDPLWFLSRQWQIGEFNGEDTGSLCYVQFSAQTAPLPRWLRTPPGGSPSEVDVSAGAPLEPQTLREPFSPDHSMAVELGHDFSDYLREIAGEAAAAPLLEEFLAIEEFSVAAIADDDDLNPVDASTLRFLMVCAGRTLNGVALYELGKAVAAGTREVPSDVTTDPARIADVETALARLVTRVGLVFGDVGTSDPDTWNARRLEYKLQVVGVDPGGAGNVKLDAFPNSDGEYEWFSFDASSRDATATEEPPSAEQHTLIPSRVEFDGMPATRFWNFEENTVSLPNVEANGADDLIKLMTVEFMMLHANDWFILPFRQLVGTLAKVDWIVVHDVFGKLSLVERAHRGAAAHAGLDRWTMFTTSDASNGSDALAEFFVLPPSSGPAMQLGSVLEDVRFGRDETANMAFGIERTTESPIGEPRSGNERAAEIDERTRQPAAPVTPSGFPLRYEVESTIPANWVPLFPVVDPEAPPSILLEVGQAVRVTDPDEAPEPIFAQSKILRPGGDPDQDYRIEEDELPREGLKVERVVYRARWIDGSTHLWVQRRRSVGAGESQSGLQFDQARPNGS